MTSMNQSHALREDLAAAASGLNWPSRKQEAWRRSPVSSIKERFSLKQQNEAAIVSLHEHPPWVGEAWVGHVLKSAPQSEEPCMGQEGAIRLLWLGSSPLVVERLQSAENSAEVTSGGASALSVRERPESVTAILAKLHTRETLRMRVSAGCALELPVELLVTGASAQEQSSGTHFVCEVGAGACLTLVERCVGNISESRSMLLEFHLGEGAQVEHLRESSPADGGYLLSEVEVNVGAGASYRSVLFARQGRYQRHDVTLNLQGEGAKADFASVVVADSDSQAEVQVKVHATAPQTHSSMCHRAVVKDRGDVGFTGTVAVTGSAPGAEAHQSAKALLLNEGAVAFVKPELFIETDEVACSHGATIGALDAAARFYLMSRGLERAVAEALLIRACLLEPLTGRTSPAARWLAALVEAELGGNIDDAVC